MFRQYNYGKNVLNLKKIYYSHKLPMQQQYVSDGKVTSAVTATVTEVILKLLSGILSVIVQTEHCYIIKLRCVYNKAVNAITNSLK